MPKPNTSAVMGTLKDFQRASVDYIIDRFHGANPTNRFLLADEVGLGKTLVARGVIARTIDKLWDVPEKRIDIVYICSNAEIARQNIRRLNVTGQPDVQIEERLSLLPLSLGDLRTNALNFLSLTPGTSLSQGHATGRSKERALLYWLLPHEWFCATGNKCGFLKRTLKYLERHEELPPALRILRGNQHPNNFIDSILRVQEQLMERSKKDPTLLQLLVLKPGATPKGLAGDVYAALNAETRKAEAEGHEPLRDRFQKLVREIRPNCRRDLTGAQTRERNAILGRLRWLIASTCVKALEPDLIIMDEFQRFRYVLDVEDETNEAAQMAKQLFDSNGARVLLLSATPYKPYSMGHEVDDDDHYTDFIKTIGFLLDDKSATREFEELLQRYRRLLYTLGTGDWTAIQSARDAIQARLFQVMARTERTPASLQRDAMLRQVESNGIQLKEAEINAYLHLQRLARELQTHDTIEYWKSSPYLLNFMEHYQLKNKLRSRCNERAIAECLPATLEQQHHLMLPWKRLRSYDAVDPSNHRLRALLADIFGDDSWQTLWLRPSLPYYEPDGAFAGPAIRSSTKRLIFSSWKVVPKAIATLVSYEAERRMTRLHEADTKNTPNDRKQRRALLRFTRTQGRLTGMPVLGMLYPSFALAKLGDPLHLWRNNASNIRPTALEMLGQIEHELCPLLEELTAGMPTDGPEDETWYWAAAILLDRQVDLERTMAWLERAGQADIWSGESDDDSDTGGGEGSLWHTHVAEACRLVRGELELKRPPDDLAQVVAQLALAGPAVTSLRALSRVAPVNDGLLHDGLRDNAGQVAWAFRSLFNVPEVMSLVRGLNQDKPPYWRRVLEYCVNGCLQSVLDEYVHVLREGLGFIDDDAVATAKGVTETLTTVVGLRPAMPGVDEIRIPKGRDRIIITPNQRLRARYAMRFGDERAADETRSHRKEDVRRAFNSPFWPFVLATTSIGQEGLDFHPYCHAVVHWNLPSNPVDLEQREGRVHRYKGHAIRKNIAQRYGTPDVMHAADDPWEAMFRAACREPERISDLTPFWLYPLEDGAYIERHLYHLPLSREWNLIEPLRHALALYRMVFGQPRQEDMMAFLARHIPRDQLLDALKRLEINLSPMKKSEVL